MYRVAEGARSMLGHDGAIVRDMSRHQLFDSTVQGSRIPQLRFASSRPPHPLLLSSGPIQQSNRILAVVTPWLKHNSSNRAPRAFRSAWWYSSYITRKCCHFASFPKPQLSLNFVWSGLHPMCPRRSPLGLHFAWRDGCATFKLGLRSAGLPIILKFAAQLTAA
jgi:hypothetical protein